MTPSRFLEWMPVSLALLMLVALAARAQRPEPEVHGSFDGEPMYTVLPPNAIPAIMAPEFVTGADAKEQMLPHEPVLGVVIDGQARAYSAWQLDAHEIVTDRGTDSVWDLEQGVCIGGTHLGARLNEKPAILAYWFAWSGFYPNTDVVD